MNKIRRKSPSGHDIAIDIVMSNSQPVGGIHCHGKLGPPKPNTLPPNKDSKYMKRSAAKLAERISSYEDSEKRPHRHQFHKPGSRKHKP